MTEERITETTTPSGNTHTTHTVVTDNEARKSGGANWGLLILLAVVAIVGVIIFTQMSGAEVAKDNAVADAAGDVGEAAGQVGEAAGQVGEAAGQVGDAAQNAGDAVSDAVQQ